MKRTVIFVRHGKIVKDPSVHATLWDLSEDAKQELQLLSEKLPMDKIDRVYASTENKSIQTAKVFADQLDLPVIAREEFCEVGRSAKFFTDEEFLEEKEKQLTDLDYVSEGGESCAEALKRFNRGLEEIDGEVVLIVSHGTVLSTYFTDLMETTDRLAAWKKLKFGSYGIVTDGEVEKSLFD
jgi:broad specificity phosphatase PhoE